MQATGRIHFRSGSRIGDRLESGRRSHEDCQLWLAEDVEVHVAADQFLVGRTSDAADDALHHLAILLPWH